MVVIVSSFSIPEAFRFYSITGIMSKSNLTAYMLECALSAQILQPIQFSLGMSFFFLKDIIETLKTIK